MPKENGIKSSSRHQTHPTENTGAKALVSGPISGILRKPLADRSVNTTESTPKRLVQLVKSGKENGQSFGESIYADATKAHMLRREESPNMPRIKQTRVQFADNEVASGCVESDFIGILPNKAMRYTRLIKLSEASREAADRLDVASAYGIGSIQASELANGRSSGVVARQFNRDTPKIRSFARNASRSALQNNTEVYDRYANLPLSIVSDLADTSDHQPDLKTSDIRQHDLQVLSNTQPDLAFRSNLQQDSLIKHNYQSSLSTLAPQSQCESCDDSVWSPSSVAMMTGISREKARLFIAPHKAAPQPTALPATFRVAPRALGGYIWVRSNPTDAIACSKSHPCIGCRRPDVFQRLS